MGGTGFILAREPEPKDGDSIKAKLKDSSDFVRKKFGNIIDRNVFDVALEYIEQLEAAQQKWISVEDELPKKWRENDTEHTLVNYQVYSPRYGVDIGNYVKPAGRWVIMGLPVDDVTHWRPLPSAPKEE